MAPTLREHVEERCQADSRLPLELPALFGQIEDAARRLAAEIRRLSLGMHGGYAGGTNVQGEAVKKLDLFGDRCFMNVFTERRILSGMVSEEQETLRRFPGATPRVPGEGFLVCIDPVDGSSNVDVNGVVGTIFSIRRGDSPLESGHRQVAAGYVMYGPATMLVMCIGDGVHGFTMDPSTHEFVLSHDRITIPAAGRTFSANAARSAQWPAPYRRFMDELFERRGYGLRYAGSMVADLHRTLLEGGVFCYPPDAKSPKGKLRMLYEVAPMSLVFEQAGGAASDGLRRILDIVPDDIHERCPLVIGGRDEVELCRSFVAAS